MRLCGVSSNFPVDRVGSYLSWVRCVSGQISSSSSSETRDNGSELSDNNTYSARSQSRLPDMCAQF